jgi:hypothetical protein
MAVLLRAATIILMGALLAAGTARASGTEKTAVAATSSWLKGVDAGHYGASWEQAAKLFRGSVTREQWEQSLAGVRAPLGKAVARQVSAKTFSDSLPGAPDGKYVVVQYATTFEQKSAAVETVTATLEPDGHWRVSGYFIK